MDFENRREYDVLQAVPTLQTGTVMKLRARAAFRITCVAAMFTLMNAPFDCAFAQDSASMPATASADSAPTTPAKQRAARHAERKAARKARRAKKNAELQSIEKNNAQSRNAGTVAPQSAFSGQYKSGTPASAAVPASAP
jgi:hypothetical protein